MLGIVATGGSRDFDWRNRADNTGTQLRQFDPRLGIPEAIYIFMNLEKSLN